MSVRTQLLKGLLEGCILAIIEEEPIYGYELSTKLQKAGLLDVSEGTIYPVLLRLQKNGAIVGEMRPSQSGPNRKYYSLTAVGKASLAEFRKEWHDLSDSISTILGGEEVE